MVERTPIPRMIATFVALIGLFDAAYLAITRIYPESLVCPTGGGCETARSSIYSIFPPGSEYGIPVAYVGVLGYIVLLALGLLSLQSDRLGPLPLLPIQMALASVGVTFSFYLLSVQLFILKIPGTNTPALCFWCVLSALCQFTILGALIADYYARRGGQAGAKAPPASRVAPRAR